MKKLMILFVAALLCISLAGCGEESTGIPNPFVDYETMAQAADKCGFSLSLPQQLDVYSDRTIQVADNGMLQVIADCENDSVLVRKAPGSDDISGDYNEYAEVKTEQINGAEVTLKGSGGLVYTCVWTTGGYSYSISVDGGLPAETMAEIIGGIK